jgi:hypothetical protein
VLFKLIPHYADFWDVGRVFREDAITVAISVRLFREECVPVESEIQKVVIRAPTPRPGRFCDRNTRDALHNSLHSVTSDDEIAELKAGELPRIVPMLPRAHLMANDRAERRARRRMNLALYPSRVRSSDSLGGERSK